MIKLAAVSITALMAFASMAGAAQAQSHATKDQKMIEQISPKPKAEKQWKKGGKYGGKGSRISNYRQHNLKAPPKGHRWVRDGNDFLLVAIGTGVIASIANGR